MKLLALNCIVLMLVGLNEVKASDRPSFTNSGATPISFNQNFKEALPAVVEVIAGEKGVDQEHLAGKTVSTGSGVVIDSTNGLIVTNKHVIDGATLVNIVTADGRRLSAEILGADSATDIAVLRIGRNLLPSININPSVSPDVGDLVFAIGYPLGLKQTITMGVISGLNRSGMDEGAFENYIQHDASINSGNSGGALVNSLGQLIGINTLIYQVNDGGNIGIGFAVPSWIVESVVSQIKETGVVSRGRIGVVLEDIAGQVGAVVSNIEPSGPAALAGLKAQDLITSVGGKQVSNANMVRVAFGVLDPKKSVQITALRNGNQINTSVTPVELVEPSFGKFTTPVGVYAIAFRDPIFEDTHSGIKKGSLIVQVSDELKNIGIRSKDIIFKFDDIDVTNSASLARLLEEGRTPKTMLVARGNSLVLIDVAAAVERSPN